MKRVLIVDHTPQLELMIRSAAGASCEVTLAPRVHAAHALLRQRAFDTIICLLSLPDGSGLEVLEHAKRRRPEALRVFYVDERGVDAPLTAAAERDIVACGLAHARIARPRQLAEITCV